MMYSKDPLKTIKVYLKRRAGGEVEANHTKPGLYSFGRLTLKTTPYSLTTQQCAVTTESFTRSACAHATRLNHAIERGLGVNDARGRCNVHP